MKDSVKYLNGIKELISIRDKQTKEFLIEIQELINELESYSNVTYDMLIDEFGTPEEIITSYFGENPDSLIANLKRKQYIKRAIITVFSIICALSLLIGGCQMDNLNKEYKQVLENKPTQYEEYIE